MAWNESAAAKRRRLARHLLNARLEAGFTAEEASSALQLPEGRVATWEDSSSCPNFTELSALAGLYGISEDLEQLHELADASRELPFSEYSDLHLPTTLRYFADESGALAITQFEPALIPGLLQTRAYTLSVLEGAFGHPADRCVRTADLRAVRQEVLSSSPRPTLSCFVDEAVVSRPVGSVDIMRDQLTQLRVMIENAMLGFRILPFSHGVHPGMRGPFTHIQLEDDESSGVIYVEDSIIEFISDDSPEVISGYLRAFNQLDAHALTPQETLELLSEKIRDWS